MHHPLDNIVVVDLSQIYNGPYATYLMALNGATVIKIEPPGGEPLRRRSEAGNAGLLPFAMLNGCKSSIVLDLKTDDGKAALRALAEKADVVVENFAPGVMDRLGVGWETLSAGNERLIYASSSGYGRDGPYASYPAMDLTIQAMCGVMYTTGFPDRPPVKAGPALADFFAGIHLYGAIATALFDRERTGRGRRLEVAMQDAVYASLCSSLGMHWASGEAAPPRTGNRHGGLAETPYNVYPANDGHIAIICVREAHWRALCKLMGAEPLSDDPRFSTQKSRVAHMDLVDSIVSDWTRRHTKEELFDRMMAAKVPCAPVRTLEEVMHDPNMHARGALAWQDHPEFGRIIVQQTPFRFDGVPLVEIEPSHRLGADTASILRDRLGLDDATIDRITATAS
ncbi:MULTISPECIES: CaiB/BaiF CoA transferase family protein [Xanthobacter]|uniref:CaiB/BaiF CoA transferase family protein n=1 Tax=Xanthobacter TaxID=279 RepID=UPI002022CD6F|nr:CoA transferase [Xanthobacter aminoxidans]MCL8382919.1 CoA transferase [Xanthobacter aminoxidans]